MGDVADSTRAMMRICKLCGGYGFAMKKGRRVKCRGCSGTGLRPHDRGRTRGVPNFPKPGKEGGGE